MEKTRVTTEALREMQMGETVTFELPDAKAVDSGKALAYRYQHTLGCKLGAVSDYANNKLTITKSPKQ